MSDDDDDEKVSRGGSNRKTSKRTIASSESHADGLERSIIVGDLSSTTEESKSCVEAIAAGVDDDIDDDDDDPQAAAKTRRTRRGQASQRPVSSWQRELDGSGGLGAVKAKARSAVASRSDGDDDSLARGSSADELLREIARLRRKVRALTNVRHDNETFAAEHFREVVDDGGDDCTSDYYAAEMMDLEETGGMDRVNPTDLGNALDDTTSVAKGQRPGAYRVRGTGDGSVSQSDDDNDASESDDDTEEVLPWRPNPPVVPPTTLTDRPFDQAMLLEADLVDESDRAIREGADAPLVTAQPIYRRQQILVVAGWNCFVCTILGLFATALLFAVVLTSPAPPETSRRTMNLTSVVSAQADFNGSLSTSTLAAIDHWPSPQAKAYRWLFGNASHPDLPVDAALERMLHRFALVTLYYSTKGRSAWKDKLGWLDRSLHECFWDGVYCRSIPVDTPWEYGRYYLVHYSTDYANASEIDVLDLGYNRLAGTIPEEIGLLVTANISTIRFELNSLTGTIPAATGNLTSLRDLSLFENQLTGSIPPTLGNLSRLTSLAMSDNQLTGPVPPELGHLSTLTSLELFHNMNLSSPFLDEICQKAESQLNVTVDCDRRGINCSCCTCT